MIDQENFGENREESKVRARHENQFDQEGPLNNEAGASNEEEVVKTTDTDPQPYDPDQFLFSDLGEMIEGPSLPLAQAGSMESSLGFPKPVHANPLFNMAVPTVQNGNDHSWELEFDEESEDLSVLMTAGVGLSSVEKSHDPQTHVNSSKTDAPHPGEHVEWESLARPDELGTKIPTDDEADFALSDEGLKQEIRNVPDRMAFKIGDVAHIVGVKTYVLRYWETEFEALKPKKSKFNQRMYTKRDVEVLLMIKKLLYNDRFSIEGARLALRRLRKEVRADRQWDTVNGRIEQARERLEDLIGDLRELKDLF